MVRATRASESAHWRYHLDKPASEPQAAEVKTDRIGVIYARVSTKKQRLHLANQTKDLRAKYPTHRVITDVASGINFKRKGLLSLLELCLGGKVHEVCITHKDRLCRFAYDLIEHLLTRNNVKITIMDQHDDATPESELADDVVSIITVFGAKLYGARSGASRRRKRQQEAEAACGVGGGSGADGGDDE